METTQKTPPETNYKLNSTFLKKQPFKSILKKTTEKSNKKVKFTEKLSEELEGIKKQNLFSNFEPMIIEEQTLNQDELIFRQNLDAQKENVQYEKMNINIKPQFQDDFQMENLIRNNKMIYNSKFAENQNQNQKINEYSNVSFEHIQFVDDFLASKNKQDWSIFQFGQMLEQLDLAKKKENFGADDILHQIEKYQEICDNEYQILKKLHASKKTLSRINQAKISQKMMVTKNERDTWMLLHMLVSFNLLDLNYDEDADPFYLESIFQSPEFALSPGFISQQNFVRKFFGLNDFLQRHQMIVKWLESAFDEDKLQTSFPSPFEKTSSPFKKQYTSEEHDFLERIWLLFRKGKMDEAVELCRTENQHWRAAILSGGDLMNDPNQEKNTENPEQTEDSFEITGYLNRSLWKQSCLNLSLKSQSKIERAIYGLLSGNLAQVFPVCSAWEDCLWVYYRSMVDQFIDISLHKYFSQIKAVFNQLKKDQQSQLHRAVLCDPHFQIYETICNQIDLSPQLIFSDLRNNLQYHTQSVRKSCSEPFHIIQQLIITGRFNELFHQLHNWIKYPQSGKTPSVILRFAAHFALIFNWFGIYPNEEIEFNEIVFQHIQNLIDSQMNDFVVFYVSHLTPVFQQNIDSFFLKHIQQDQSGQKYIHVEISQLKKKSLDLDFAAQTQFKLDDIFNLKYTPESVNNAYFKWLKKHILERVLHPNPIAKENSEKIVSVKWLFDFKKPCVDSLAKCNQLAREFVGKDFFNEAQKVIMQIVPTNIFETLEETMETDQVELIQKNSVFREYNSWQIFFEGITAFDDWVQHYYSFSEKKSKLYEKSVSIWKEINDVKIQFALAKLFQVVSLEGGWMNVGDSDSQANLNQNDLQMFQFLREKCIPLSIILIQVLLLKSKKFKELSELANLVATEQTLFYRYFSSQSLEYFLFVIRESVIEEGNLR
ncbi:nuclear pore complex protein nup107 [Anaeramoeba ignava]|uniref:Nuclear pore complex protein n=1 Tax=Anaeramoeba ignava TaxID=1746090 RepID=A0A9Q0LJ55_ANAIG|nr:nuclear pore complex protein nup107 [Anaeramoeba ignava]